MRYPMMSHAASHPRTRHRAPVTGTAARSPGLDQSEPVLEAPDARESPLEARIGRRGTRSRTRGQKPRLGIPAHALEVLVEGMTADEIVVDLECLGVVALRVVEVRERP